MEEHRASSIPRATARCCRSCTSTATRSPARPCSARETTTTIRELLEGHGYEVHVSPATIRSRVHQAARRRRSMTCFDRIRAIQADARARGAANIASGRAGRRSFCARRRVGPGPKVVDGMPVEGTFRSHQVPLPQARSETRRPGDARGVAAELPAREAFRRTRARSSPSSPTLAPRGDRRMGANPHANGGRAAASARRARLPRLRGRRVARRRP